MKTPLALLLNDIHVNKDNIAEFEKNWDEALSLCERELIDNIIIGGDMFTTRANQTLSTLLSVKKAINRATKQGIEVIIAEGNHDKSNPEELDGYNHLWVGLPNVIVIDDYEIFAWDDCDFVLLVMSYFPENGSFFEHLKTAVDVVKESYPEFVRSDRDIILYIHEGIHGALGDFEIPGELPQEPFLNFKKVLCGHYHNRIKIKNTPIEYIGSSRQHNFGEDEEKGYTILYSDGSTRFVKNLVNTRYVTIELKAEDVDTYLIEENSLYKHRLKIKCDAKQAQLIDKQKLLERGFAKIEIVSDEPNNKEVTSVGISEKYDRPGLKIEYQKYCQENSIDSRLGIKYLEG